MSGYEKSSVSALGGGIPGQSIARYGNAMVGGEVATKRAVLRRAFRNNKIKKNGVVVGKSHAGPFRSSISLGDGLTRLNKSCGAASQMNRTGRGLVGVRLGNGVSNKDCGMEVDINGEAVSTNDVPLESGNAKYVSDSSLYTNFKHLEKVGKLYNDKSVGGNDHNAGYTFINHIRHR